MGAFYDLSEGDSHGLATSDALQRSPFLALKKEARPEARKQGRC